MILFILYWYIQTTKIVVNYKKIDYNVSIRFPFNIPNGYEEIQIN